MRFRGSNPVIRSIQKQHHAVSDYAATYGGVIWKSGLLLGIMAVFGVISFSRMFGLSAETDGIPTSAIVFLIASPIIALISVFIAMRKPGVAPFFSIIYAICQGTFLGFISGLYEYSFGDGIVATAMLATMGVFTGMLVLYSTGVFRVTAFFRKVLFTALIGLLISGFMLLILSLTGFFAGNPEGFMTIIFVITIIAVVVASLYLLVDFDNIQKVVSSGADKQYEWALSLGLIVTLVWLYVELLRLIAILRSRRS